jgi:hypothetical protein
MNTKVSLNGELIFNKDVDIQILTKVLNMDVRNLPQWANDPELKEFDFTTNETKNGIKWNGNRKPRLIAVQVDMILKQLNASIMGLKLLGSLYIEGDDSGWTLTLP